MYTKYVPNGSAPIALITGLDAPEGVAVDAAGNVYFTDKVANTLTELPAGGGSAVVLASGLNAPYGVTIDPAGNVFADQGNKAVKRIPAGGGGHPVNIASAINLEVPGAVALDANGNIYISDWENEAIYEITPGYFINPTLSAGLSINQNTGIISGYPTAPAAKTNYTVSARNSGRDKRWRP